GANHVRYTRRRAGLGSLGLDRVLAVADWGGALVAHEAKAMAPSAWEWAHPQHASNRTHYLELVAQAVRSPDPMLEVADGWLLRRLSPDCSRILLDELPKRRDEGRLLKAMGWEAANIHLGTGGAGGGGAPPPPPAAGGGRARRRQPPARERGGGGGGGGEKGGPPPPGGWK